MARQYDIRELWDCVNRAETISQIKDAEAFLGKLDYIDNDTYDEMMDALANKSRELYRRRYMVGK